MYDPTKPDDDNEVPTDVPLSDTSMDQSESAQGEPTEVIRGPISQPGFQEDYSDVPPPEEPKPGRMVKPLGKPMRLVFGEMAGVLFLVWIPVVVAFWLPWARWVPQQWVAGIFPASQFMVALVIALPPWIILFLHLIKGRLLDGILDMLLWGIWECGAMITLCYCYPDQAQDVIWNATAYLEEMQDWLINGGGREGDPSQWWLIHLMHFGVDIVGGFILGLPALILGVFQLNYMNYYVAQMLLSSDNVFLVLPVAWHFWSILRVAGFIVVACAMFQIFMKLVFRAPGRYGAVLGSLAVGVILVILDAVLKWQYAESIREILVGLCGY